MPSGSAQGRRAGPAPDPNALRRDRPGDQGEWVTLPAEGRPALAPEWPLTKPTARESALWSGLWAKPQAVEWERLGNDQMVAMYVRRLTVAEKRNCPANALTIVRQLAESLGLTPAGLRSNRWKIAPLPTPAGGTELASVTGLASARDRAKGITEDAEDS